MIRGRFWAWASLLLIAACQDQTPSDNSSLSARALPGGHATHINLNPLGDRSADAFSQPAANLPLADRGRFALGNSFFTSPWVSAPASTRARDGLGPLFDAAACQDCHVRDGRGHAPPGPDQALTAAVIRLAGPQGTPDPTYGAQLQTHAVAGLAPEARVRVLWQTHTVTLPDGVEVELRSPRLELSNLSDGALASETRAGLRIAPPMIGLGLLFAAGVGAASFAYGYPFLTTTFEYLKWPVVGKFEVASALIFDLGVYLTVIGATLLALVSIGRLSPHSAIKSSKETH